MGANLYFAAKVVRQENYEIGFGYSFEQACLYALSLGMATVMLAASLYRSVFEKAMNVQENEVMPVTSPIGYPAEKSSFRESMMRKGLKADNRIDFENLFFFKEYDRKMNINDAGIFFNALEMARLAPSDGNVQPWRAIIDDDMVHFFEKKSMKDNPIGDIQKVDVGIAICHFDLTMKEEGNEGVFINVSPKLSLPENVHYIISYKINKKEK